MTGRGGRFVVVARAAWSWAWAPYVVSLAVQLLLAPLLVHDWDGYVFVGAANDWLHGKTPYAIAEENPLRIHLSTTWPSENTWYAYPPLPLLLMTPFVGIARLLGGSPWLLRAAIKVPFIASTLVIAWLARRLLERWSDAATARTWERRLVLNPLLVFMAGAWGMFDGWVAASLLAALLAIELRRFGLAGAAFAGGVLCKLFPIFAAPCLALYVVRRAGWRAAAALVASAVATALVVCVPFAAGHWRGFYHQVFGLHAARPPQGLSLFAAIGEFRRIAALVGVNIGEAPPAVLATVSLFVVVGVTLTLTLASMRAQSGPTIARALLVILLGAVTSNKVVNEQYFVLPLGLFAIVAGATETHDRWSRRGYAATTYGPLVAALLMGWHAFTFWPRDVAVRFFGMPADEAIEPFRRWLALPPPVFAFLPYMISFAACLPAFGVAAVMIAEEVNGAVDTVAAVLSRASHGTHRGRFAAVFVITALMVLLPFGGYAAVHEQEPPPRAPLDSRGKHVGAFYYLWWSNSTHDPAIPGGNWQKITQHPVDGYYTVTAEKVRADFARMRAHGIDLVVVSFHDYDTPLLPTVLAAAAETGVLVAPLIELEEIYGQARYQAIDAKGKPLGAGQGLAMNDATRRAIVRLTSKALAPLAKAPAAYRPDGKLAVFFYDSYFGTVDSRPDFRAGMLDRAAAMSPGTLRTTLAAALPKREHDLSREGGNADIWRRAYVGIYRDFWRGVLGDLSGRFGPLFSVGAERWASGWGFSRGVQIALEGRDVFDASYVYSPSFVWVETPNVPYEGHWQQWELRQILQAEYARGAHHPVIATVAPAYDDRANRHPGFAIPADGPSGGTYDRTWDLASKLRADLVLVATWNEFYEGSGIEPTTEFGDRFLDATAAWSAKWRADPPPPRRALVLTGEASSHYLPGAADEHWTGESARHVQHLAELLLRDHVVEAIDTWQIGSQLDDPSRYDLIVVDAGANLFRGDEGTALGGALERWVRRGGRLLVSGCDPGAPFVPLWGAHPAPPEDTTSTRVVLPDGTGAPVKRTPRTRRVVVTAPDAVVRTRFDATDAPASWSYPLGDGVVAGTAFRFSSGPDGGATEALFCAVVAPLLRDPAQEGGRGGTSCGRATPPPR